MKTLATEITINASAKTVWNILMDFEKHPEWNPFIKQLEGTAWAGEQLRVLIQPPNQKPSKFTPKVVQVSPQKYFSWKGTFLASWIMTGEHIFEIKPLGENQVKFVHYENFRGLLAGIIMKKIGESTKQGFVAMNEAIKKKAEMVTV